VTQAKRGALRIVSSAEMPARRRALAKDFLTFPAIFRIDAQPPICMKDYLARKALFPSLFGALLLNAVHACSFFGTILIRLSRTILYNTTVKRCYKKSKYHLSGSNSAELIVLELNVICFLLNLIFKIFIITESELVTRLFFGYVVRKMSF